MRRAVVRVDVAFAVVAQVAGDFEEAALAHVFLCGGYREVCAVAFGRGGQVYDGFAEYDAGLGHSDAVYSRGCVLRYDERHRVGEADVL